MTVQEAIERFKALAQDERGDLCKAAVEALEKQIPRKLRYDEKGELIYDIAYCPNCEKQFEVYYDHARYCPDCGQALDWSEEE